HEPRWRGGGVLTRSSRPRGELLGDLAERFLTTATSLHGTREIVRRESIERRDREVVDVPRIRRKRDRGEERDEETDLGTLVQLAAAGEVRGDLSLRKGVEERRRVGVVPNQDREVAEAPLTANGFARDEIRHSLSFFDAGHLLDVVDIDLVRRL